MKKRIGKWVLAVLAIWVVVVCAISAVAALEARSGQHKLTAVVDKANIDGVKSGAIDKDLKSASSSMGGAHSLLANPVMYPVRALPWVGTQLKSAIALTDAGKRSTKVVLAVSQQARTLTNGPITDRPATLKSLGDLCANQDDELKKAKVGPKGNLVSPLKKGRQKAVDNLNRLDDILVRSAGAAHGMSTMLGNNGNYLLIAGNNGEMRAGSGMFLSAGLLQTNGGKMSVSDMEPFAGTTSPITWPADYDNNWGWLEHKNDPRNLMLSPRLDASAPLAKQIWETSGHPAVNGVITMDVAMLQSLLKITGPVTADGVKVDATNVSKTLLFDQYAKVDANAVANAQRRDAQSAIAKEAFNAFNKNDIDILSAAKELSAAANGRHLMIWSADTNTNANWRDANLDGELGPEDTMLNVINLGTNKLDQFLKITADMSTKQEQTTFDTTIDVTIENTAPADGPQYVLGPVANSGLVKGEYQGVLALTLPQDVTNVAWQDGLELAIGGPDGDTVQTGTRIDIKRGETQTFTVKYSRLPNVIGTNVVPSARINPTEWHFDTQVWKDDHERELVY